MGKVAWWDLRVHPDHQDLLLTTEAEVVEVEAGTLIPVGASQDHRVLRGHLAHQVPGVLQQQ